MLNNIEWTELMQLFCQADRGLIASIGRRQKIKIKFVVVRLKKIILNVVIIILICLYLLHILKIKVHFLEKNIVKMFHILKHFKKYF